MKSKLIAFLTLILGIYFCCYDTARADTCNYDSVEWMTCMADNIGIYQADRIYGPYAITNYYPAATQWRDGYYSAEFKLQKILRGNPPKTFSRTGQVKKTEDLGFHIGDTYIFFMVNDGRRTIADPNANQNYSPPEIFFSMWDYVWLERPQGVGNGVAINYEEKILTNRDEIIKTVEHSLKLPRADTKINHWTYFYENPTNYNYAIIDFPTGMPGEGPEPWRFNTSSQGLVIPKILAANKTANP